MAHQIIEVTVSDDHAQNMQTNYYCSECDEDCGKQTSECPYCNVVFDQGSIMNEKEYFRNL